MRFVSGGIPLSRGQRGARYRRMLRIEQELGGQCRLFGILGVLRPVRGAEIIHYSAICVRSKEKRAGRFFSVPARCVCYGVFGPGYAQARDFSISQPQANGPAIGEISRTAPK